jgi:RimJ/RimL family protein N-acetyltransferase
LDEVSALLWALAVTRFGYWVAEDKATGYFVGGLVSLTTSAPCSRPSKACRKSGGYWSHQRTAEASQRKPVRAVGAWGDEHLPSPQTACIIAPENLPSIRVAVKCGYRASQPATYKGQPRKVFIRDRNPSR